MLYKLSSFNFIFVISQITLIIDFTDSPPLIASEAQPVPTTSGATIGEQGGLALRLIFRRDCFVPRNDAVASGLLRYYPFHHIARHIR